MPDNIRPAPPGCIIVPVEGRSITVRRHGGYGWQLSIALADEAEAARVTREIALARLSGPVERP